MTPKIPKTVADTFSFSLTLVRVEVAFCENTRVYLSLSYFRIVRGGKKSLKENESKGVTH